MGVPKKNLKGLGRGFESLIPTDLLDDTFNPMAIEERKVSSDGILPVSQIQANPDQPRRHFDDSALAELAESIKEHGVLQPILVVPIAGDSVFSLAPGVEGDSSAKYQIVAGERRFRASKLAGLKEVPVIIRTMSDQNQLEVSLIENIQRRDLNAIETAVSYAKLRDQFNLTNEQIAKRVGKSTSAVTNTMRLLKLPSFVIELVATGELKEGQVRPLVGQDESILAEIIPKIVEQGWSSRKIEQYIAKLKQGDDLGDTAEVAADSSNSNDVEFEQKKELLINNLGGKLDTKVDVKIGKRGAGKITISFKTAEDLERIRQIIS